MKTETGRFYILRETNPKAWTVRDHTGRVFYCCQRKQEALGVCNSFNRADRR
jgi:hypothetical protein